MKLIRFKPCGYVQNSNDKKYRLKWRTWPDPPIPTISRLLSRNCTEYLPACTWNNIWDRIRIRKTKYKPENTLTYTYFKNLPSVQSATITHYYTTHKADSSPFSPLSVLSADDKNSPSSFLIPKRPDKNRQPPYPPIANYKQQQAVQVSFANLINTFLLQGRHIKNYHSAKAVTIYYKDKKTASAITH